jgi:two-component system phosphate regulon sensor histidine kinase PhoR
MAAISLPVVYMDILFLATLQLVFLTVGAVGGWQLSRRRATAAPPREVEQSRALLRAMARADHARDNATTSIQGHLAVLGHGLPADEERWRISRDAIADAATQMRTHVERLRLVRLGLDDANLRVAPVNLAKLIEVILIALEPAATQREVTLRMDVQRPNAPVSGDPQMFEEIFRTLLDNAIKHNPPGTEVVAELSTRDGMALTRISDTGEGVRQHLMANLFEEGATDRQAGAPRGTGMGLYIARMLTELHSGTITLESEPGRGSVFSVALPLASQALQAESTWASLNQAAALS